MLKLLLEGYKSIKVVLKLFCDGSGGVGCVACQRGVGWGCICMRGGGWENFFGSGSLDRIEGGL